MRGLAPIAGALIAGVAALAGAAAAQAPDEGRLMTAAQLRAAVAKTGPGGSVNAPVPTGPGATVLAVKRDATGEVEVHTKLNDEFVVLDGHASVRVGGKLEGARETAPGEWRGGTISGGHSYELAPGDVLWIPAGAPHQVLATKAAPFLYLAVKFEAK
jgi:mannose-6-phosphate isomerase-like protein (cupin superfamily)